MTLQMALNVVAFQVSATPQTYKSLKVLLAKQTSVKKEK